MCGGVWRRVEVCGGVWGRVGAHHDELESLDKVEACGLLGGRYALRAQRACGDDWVELEEERRGGRDALRGVQLQRVQPELDGADEVLPAHRLGDLVPLTKDDVVQPLLPEEQRLLQPHLRHERTD